VDTHALVWYIEGSAKLGSAAKAVLDDPASDLVLPLIALAEAVDIVDKGRTKIPDVPTLLDRVFNDPRLELYPFTLEILEQSRSATSVPEMHDRLIVSTGLYLQSLGDSISILTKDVSITTSALLPVIWS
jgi:PIN domain nuclease of toxin-antitoxin system